MILDCTRKILTLIIILTISLKAAFASTRRRMSPPPMQVLFEAPDKYGQIHPIESDELIIHKLRELDRTVSKMPKKCKKCLLQAQEQCPQLLTDDFKLMFLRCDVFNVEKAAARYVAYWDKRVEIFGPNAAFQPLTLALLDTKSDRVAREKGVFNMFEANGRMVMFDVARHYSLEGTSRESYVKTFWYIVHTVLEHEETQRRGIFVLNDPVGVNLRTQKDLILVSMISSLKGVLPVRVSAYHVVKPPSFLKIFLPLLYFFVGEHLRKRILIHTGTREEVLERLFSYGFKSEELPICIGGERIVDMKAFFDKRQSVGC